jgi:hypothetical protein
MKTIVPCNSFIDLKNEDTKPYNSPTTDKTACSTRFNRRSKLSMTDIQIIQSSMTPQRKKTLMITEQSNFILLNDFKTQNFPKKKFKTKVPSEYTKHILEKNKMDIKNNDNVKYSYPDNVLSCDQIDRIMRLDPQEYSKLKSTQFNTNHKRNKSNCSVF